MYLTKSTRLYIWRVHSTVLRTTLSKYEVDYRFEDDFIQTDTGHFATYTFHVTGRHQVQPLPILPR